MAAGPVRGMQAERTGLAWQRAGLSVVVAAAVLARLTVTDLGGWALLALAVSLALCGWVLVDSRGRYRGAALADRRPAIGPWAAALTGSVVVLGVTELAALLATA